MIKYFYQSQQFCSNNNYVSRFCHQMGKIRFADNNNEFYFYQVMNRSSNQQRISQIDKVQDIS